MLAFPAVLAAGAWACKRLLGKIFPSDKKIEILAIAMERGDAWSCGRHLMTMRAELRIKAIVLKMLEQKEGRALLILLSGCPNPETFFLP